MVTMAKDLMLHSVLSDVRRLLLSSSESNDKHTISNILLGQL